MRNFELLTCKTVDDALDALSAHAEDGKIIEDNLQFYRLPLAVDIPKVEYIAMENDNNEGPFGAKGSGEAPVLLPPAVIASAVADAIGKSIRKIPATPEDVLEARA